MDKYYYNEEMYRWERIGKVQEYKGVKIETMYSHGDYFNAPVHREYRVTWPNGRVSYSGINKRGDNITSLKQYIDFKAKYNEL